MTKHLTITAKIPLPDDHFEQADILVAGKKLKAAMEEAAKEHLPGATVEHAITSPEPVKAPRKSRVRDVGPPAGPAHDPMKPDAKADAKPAAKKAA